MTAGGQTRAAAAATILLKLPFGNPFLPSPARLPPLSVRLESDAAAALPLPLSPERAANRRRLTDSAVAATAVRFSKDRSIHFAYHEEREREGREARREIPPILAAWLAA